MIKIFLFLPLILLFMLPVVIAIISAAGFGIWRALTFETRFRRFFQKYDSNEELARMIAGRKIWTGQSADELRDAKGPPLQVENIPGGEIWHYKENPLTRMPLRITMRDGRIANWSN